MSAGAMERREFRPGNAWLAGIVLAVLTYWLFAQTLLNVIPGISASLGLESSIATLAVSITALFGGIFIVVAGGIADRWGANASSGSAWCSASSAPCSLP